MANQSFSLGHPKLCIPKHVVKEIVVCNHLLDDLGEFLHIRQIDHCMNALLKRLHGMQGLKGTSEEEADDVPPLIHRHRLQIDQGFILQGGGGVEQFLKEHNLVLDLG